MDHICARDAEGTNWFHISTKGIDRSLFKTPEDFHQALNIIAICAAKFEILIFAYCLMSNHIHTAIHAMSELIANRFINCVKQNYSRYYRRVYGVEHIFDEVPVSVRVLKTKWDLKNCIAYILRNPVEARICRNADQYLWSSYSCYFKSEAFSADAIPVNTIPYERTRKILRTHTNLTSSTLYMSPGGHILPESFVESLFVEELLGNSREELSKSITLNPYLATEYELANPIKVELPHYELVRIASELAVQDFGQKISMLDMKARIPMAKRLYSKYGASPYQICQILGLSRNQVNQVLGITK